MTTMIVMMTTMIVMMIRMMMVMVIRRVLERVHLRRAVNDPQGSYRFQKVKRRRKSLSKARKKLIGKILQVVC